MTERTRNANTTTVWASGSPEGHKMSNWQQHRSNPAKSGAPRDPVRPLLIGSLG
jgi:hypothetical protein